MINNENHINLPTTENVVGSFFMVANLLWWVTKRHPIFDK